MSPDEPATPQQIERLRELARDFGLPPEAGRHVEELIATGLSQVSAYELIRRYGARIQKMRNG